MSGTAHTVVYDAVVAALQAAPALADGHVKTTRDTNRRMPEGVTRQLRVFLDQTRPIVENIGGNAPLYWQTRLRVECLARDTLGVTPASAFDTATELAAAVQARLLADSALAALIVDISPGPMAWAEDEADTQLTACQVLFDVQHRSAYATLLV